MSSGSEIRYGMDDRLLDLQGFGIWELEFVAIAIVSQISGQGSLSGL